MNVLMTEPEVFQLRKIMTEIQVLTTLDKNHRPSVSQEIENELSIKNQITQKHSV